MASNGLLRKAKKGRCRMCQRVRSTETQVKAVGEIAHGFATGHIWECIDEKECEEAMTRKISEFDPETAGPTACRDYNKIINSAIPRGRLEKYTYFL